MPVTLTIKQVPERLAEGLRQRAAANRRSQQQELLLLLERAVADGAAGVSEPTRAVYRTGAAHQGKPDRKARSGKSPPSQQPAGKLSLDALWRRARKLGAGMPSESPSIVRADRDAGRR